MFQGKVIQSNVKGEVVVRNYIPGQSTIKLGLNENLLVGSDAAGEFNRISISNFLNPRPFFVLM